jgi:hypothetical protein
VDVSFYGAGLQLVPHGRGARLVEENGKLVVGPARGRTMRACTHGDLFGPDLPAVLRLGPEDAARLLAARFGTPLTLGAATSRRIPEILAKRRVLGASVYEAVGARVLIVA